MATTERSPTPEPDDCAAEEVDARRIASPPTHGEAGRAPLWLRGASDPVGRLLLMAFAVVALVYALGYLRIVVLPIIVALLLTTLLLPPARWLRSRGLPDGLAAAGAIVGALLVLVAVGSAIAPTIGGQTSQLGTGIEDGIRQATPRPPGQRRMERIARAFVGVFQPPPPSPPPPLPGVHGMLPSRLR